jgi:uncharacterized protein (TIGR00288 family)
MSGKKTILYVDGENFLFKTADVLKGSQLIHHKSDIVKFNFSMLRDTALSEYVIDEMRFYAAKVHLHRESPALERKSRQIIESQRKLKRSLTNDGVDFITSGNVRLQETVPATGSTPAQYTFKEKGTDVQMAVDILANVCDDGVSTILILSSDSDMQPVVKEAKRRGCRLVYVGFEDAPNVGLSNTCHQTILLRKKEIIDAWTGQPPLAVQ